MTKYDLAIIGGGPAGMMAAVTALQNDKKIIILEKNSDLGAKLLITGKGRCNITNYTIETKELISQYGEKGKFLFSQFHAFTVEDTIKFFEDGGLETKIERGNRVFPKSDKSKDILQIFKDILYKNKVKIEYNSQVDKFISKENKIEKIILKNGQTIKAKNFLIATGGKSFPGTGSTGDGYTFAKNLGHTVNTPKPALAPIILKEKFIKGLEGLSLKNVNISIWQNNKKIIEKFGEAIFTNVGMSGPIIIDLSETILELLSKKTELKIDFKPALNFQKLEKRILREFDLASNKQFKNILNSLLPQKLIPIILQLSEINPQKAVNLVTKEERKKLLHLLKEFTLNIKAVEGFNKAIITNGGVETKEINPKTMKSKIIENLYFAGEVIDVHGPTGGYNLQVCWSSGYTAGLLK